MRFGPDKKFSIKNCYYALNFGGVSCTSNTEIWHSFAPKKCKIFAWLALHNRLSMSMWGKFGVHNIHGLGSVQDSIINPRLVEPARRKDWATIINPRLVEPARRKDWATIFIAIAWNMLARNRKVFDNVNMPANSIEKNCWDTISLWARRCNNSARRKAIGDCRRRAANYWKGRSRIISVAICFHFLSLFLA
jgi:hypothetical protein